MDRLRQLLDHGERTDLDLKRVCDLNVRSELLAIVLPRDNDELAAAINEVDRTASGRDSASLSGTDGDQTPLSGSSLSTRSPPIVCAFREAVIRRAQDGIATGWDDKRFSRPFDSQDGREAERTAFILRARPRQATLRPRYDPNMTAGGPPVVDEILRLDDDGLAFWLLRELDEAPPIEKGENYIGERLARWFPNAKAIGHMTQVNQVGIPLASSTQPDRVERRLRDAYSRLTSRNWIRPDPHSGGTFCEITDEGMRQLAVAPGNDPDRMGFAATALTFDLHQALRDRHIDANFRQGRYETALRDSSAFLEGAIRTLSGLPANTVGVQLAEEAFRATKGKLGPLTDPNEHPGQAAGLQRLFMGYFGAVRNVVAHTQFRYSDPKEAFQILMLVDLLTGKLEEVAKRVGQQLP